MRAEAPDDAPAEGDKPAAEAAEAPAEALPEAPADDLEEVAAPKVSAAAGERAELEKQLQAVTLERENSSNLWPWLSIALGATAVVTGTTVGVARSFECEVDEPGCNAPPWAELTVVIGMLIGTLGTVWLVRTNHAINELELKKDKIRYDLDRLDAARARRTGLARASGSQLQWTLQF
ncbi:MAG TPA: hypothetical protein VJV78_38905 [Polyangiales bacterium]|nr:hypothetical protein [Polyangiales bacterium]